MKKKPSWSSSGGRDSTTCLVQAGPAMTGCMPSPSITASAIGRRLTPPAIWRRRSGSPPKVMDVAMLGELAISALTRDDIPVSFELQENGLPNTFVPGRNILFLTLAAIYAYQVGAEAVITGVCETGLFRLSRLPRRLRQGAQSGGLLGLDRPIRFETPDGLDKAETWALADHYGHLDAVRHQTLTCYNGVQGDGCGACPACELRRRGLDRYLADKTGIPCQTLREERTGREKRILSLCLARVWGIIRPFAASRDQDALPNQRDLPDHPGEGYLPACPPSSFAFRGCPVGCPWCDTRHTWVVDPEREVALARCSIVPMRSDGWSKMSTEDILASFTRLGYRARHVVLTGGEPCLYDLRELSSALVASGYQVQIEPAGPASADP